MLRRGWATMLSPWSSAPRRSAALRYLRLMDWAPRLWRDAFEEFKGRQSHDRRSRAGQASRSRFMRTVARPLQVGQACDAVSPSPFEPERAGSRGRAVRRMLERLYDSTSWPRWTVPRLSLPAPESRHAGPTQPSRSVEEVVEARGFARK